MLTQGQPLSSDAEQKLQAIFRSVLNLGDEVDVTGARQLSEPSWDSLAHVSLVAALESEFAVSIDTGDSMNLTSYQAVKLFLEEGAGA